MVLRGQEGGVEDDAEGDGGVEQHVMNNHIENILETEPQVVVYAALSAAGAVSVISGF